MYFCVSCHPAPLLLCTNATLCNTATAGDAGLPVSHDPSPTAPPRPRAGSALSPRIMLGVLEVSMVHTWCKVTRWGGCNSVGRGRYGVMGNWATITGPGIMMIMRPASAGPGPGPPAAHRDGPGARWWCQWCDSQVTSAIQTLTVYIVHRDYIVHWWYCTWLYYVTATV